MKKTGVGYTLVACLMFVVQSGVAYASPTDDSFMGANFSACAENAELCQDVVRYEHYVIVRKPVIDCPAGEFYLVDNRRLEIVGLDAETCSPHVEWKFQKVGEENTPMAVLYLEGKPFRMYSL